MILFLVIVCFSILILVHELGHFLAAKIFGIKVMQFGIGFPPKILWKKIGETEYSINLLPFGGFVKIYGEDPEEVSCHGEKERSFWYQSAWKQSSVMLAGIFMNVLLAWVILGIIFSVGTPQRLMITDIAAGSSAEAAGVERGDVVLETRAGNSVLRDPILADEFVALSREQRGQEMFLRLERSGKTIETRAFLRSDVPEGQGALGVALVDIGFPAEPFPKSFITGAAKTWETMKLIISSFANLLSGLLARQSGVTDHVTGPVGIISIATQAGSLGFVYLAQLMALISINLAVLNLIPFPALDGGQFLIVIFEKLIGRKAQYKTKAIINGAGMAALILLLILVTVRDVGQLVK